MPFINVKLVKGQATAEQKQQVIAGVTDLVVKVMGRDRDLTVVVLDELEASQWAIGGRTLAQLPEKPVVSFVNIKISKGTSNPAEMAAVLRAGKERMSEIFGNSAATNYFIIDELNPDAWGLDGITMTERNRQAR